jgi:phage-related protein
MSAIPGVGLLAAAFIANFKAIKASQPWDDLTSAWHRFATATNPAIMKPVVTAIQAITSLLQRGVPIVNAFAGVLGGFLAHVKSEMASPAFDKFLNWVRTVGAVNFSNLLRATENLVVGLAHLGMAFSQQGLNITQWLADITAKFRTWSANLQGSNGLGGFINYFKSTWPSLKNLVGELFTALSHITLAVAPLSKTFIDFFATLLHGFNSIPVSVLSNLLRAFVALKVAAYAFAAAQVAVNAAMATNPITAVVVALAALAAAFVVAYHQSKTFRDAVDSGLRQVGAAAKQMMAAAKPVFDWFKSPQGAASMKVAIGLVATGVRVSSTLIASQLRTLASVARAVFPAIATQMRVVSTAFQAVGNLIRSQANAIRTAFNLVKTAWSAVGSAFRATGSAIQGVVRSISSVVRSLGSAVQSAMNAIKAALAAARAAWSSMLAVMRQVPSFGWVSAAAGAIRGLIGAASAAAGAVGSLIHAISSIPSLPHLSLPHFAAGGRPPVGQISLVGEQGPELFVPDRAGTIIPADKTAQMVRHTGTPVGQGQGQDLSELLEELRGIRELLARLPRIYLQQQRLGGTA